MGNSRTGTDSLKESLEQSELHVTSAQTQEQLESPKGHQLQSQETNEQGENETSGSLYGRKLLLIAAKKGPR